MEIFIVLIVIILIIFLLNIKNNKTNNNINESNKLIDNMTSIEQNIMMTYGLFMNDSIKNYVRQLDEKNIMLDENELLKIYFFLYGAMYSLFIENNISIRKEINSMFILLNSSFMGNDNNYSENIFNKMSNNKQNQKYNKYQEYGIQSMHAYLKNKKNLGLLFISMIHQETLYPDIFDSLKNEKEEVVNKKSFKINDEIKFNENSFKNLLKSYEYEILNQSFILNSFSKLRECLNKDNTYIRNEIVNKDNYQTLLMILCQNYKPFHFNTIELLIKNNVNINIKDIDEKNSLDYLIENYNSDKDKVIKLLLKSNIEIKKSLSDKEKSILLNIDSNLRI